MEQHLHSIKCLHETKCISEFPEGGGTVEEMDSGTDALWSKRLEGLGQKIFQCSSQEFTQCYLSVKYVHDIFLYASLVLSLGLLPF